MRHSDIAAVIAQLATMWPGDFPDEARLVWTTKLAPFDDDDPIVRTAFDACLEECTFRPTWADFSTAYKAAQKAAYLPARQQFTAIERQPYTGPNPATRIKSELAARQAELRRPQHPYQEGDLVTVDRVQLAAEDIDHSRNTYGFAWAPTADPLQGKTGTYLGMTPDNEWLQVNIAGVIRTMKPEQLTPQDKT